MLEILINEKSTWNQVMAWCHEATSHYLSHIYKAICRHWAIMSSYIVMKVWQLYIVNDFDTPVEICIYLLDKNE